MEPTDCMICTFLIAQLCSLRFFVLVVPWSRCRTSGSPRRERLEETNSRSCSCHTTLPVVRPEKVEACQRGGSTSNISLEVLFWVICDKESELQRNEKLRADHTRQANADNLCAGEDMPDSGWSRQGFTRPSHHSFLAPAVQNCTKGIRSVIFRNELMAA